MAIEAVKKALREAWWFIRGVDAEKYRRTCARCGQTGQVHWHLSCVRFKQENVW